MKHPIPLSILDAHLALLGKTGAGKSYALRGLIEMLLDHKRRVCIIDPKGDHWGIRSSADGKKAGYPVVAFGNFKVKVEDAVPITARVGGEVAELVATGNRPCVIGFRGWMPGDRTRFWIDFASTLFNKNDAPLWLIIDEIHNFAPQGKVLDPEAGKSLHWSNRIATEGRGLGIHLLMASQRPQKVHKDTLTCAETLVAMRVVHPLDRAPVKDWIDGCGDPERGKEVLNALAQMKTGDAYVWSPEAEFFERLKFPRIKTFDSFKAPTGDSKEVAPSGWAEVDLDEVKKRLAATIEEAKANDPELLKKEIRKLQMDLRAKRPQIDESAVSHAMERAKLEAKRESAAQIKSLEIAVARQQGLMRKAAEMLAGAAVTVPSHVPAPIRIPVESIPGKPISRRMQVDRQFAASNVDVDHRIIDMVATLDARGIRVTREAVARWLGIHPNGGRYLTNLATLRAEGFLDGWALTAAGSAAATPHATGLDAALSALKDEGKKKILSIVAEAGPLSREELADRLDIHPNGGRFLTNLAWLRDMGIITERGPIQLTEGCKS